VTYNELGRYGEAKRVYGDAMARAQSEPRLLDSFAKGKLANMHAHLADAYHGIGLHAEATREYRQALTLCPTFVDLRTKLGNTLRDMGRIDEAIAEYREVLETNPNYLPGRLQLGVTLYTAGRVDEAVAEWRKASQIDPDNKSARSYLKMLGEASATGEHTATQ
jgi:tetratricopeptide (TPR) repeat protein